LDIGKGAGRSKAEGEDGDGEKVENAHLEYSLFGF
jgi:hypothetical protein